jgi:hypothetical protein
METVAARQSDTGVSIHCVEADGADGILDILVVRGIICPAHLLMA